MSLLMAKSRVTPMRATTIPRLELSAAAVASKVSNLLNSELDIAPLLNEYWCDSKIVLGYITNEVKRFKIYVANRAQLIREMTDIDRWHYIPSADNPADFASRGLEVDAPEVEMWFKGPPILWDKEETYKTSNERYTIDDDDPEIKKVIHVNTISLSDANETNLLSKLESRVSGWYRCIRLLGCIQKVHFYV